jgi:hypothetical protein
VISFCVTPSILLLATVLIGRDSFPSLGNHGSWLSLVFEMDPSTLTLASVGAVCGDEEPPTGAPSETRILLHKSFNCLS